MLTAFRERAERNGTRVALEESIAGGARADRQLTWREWYDASRCFAAALIAKGIGRGDMVAILAGNRMLWPVADLAVLMAGAVSVGIYPTSAPAQIAQQLTDSGAVAVVVDTAEQLAKIDAVRDQLPRVRMVVVDDATATTQSALAWEDVLAAGARALRDAPNVSELDGRIARASLDDPALLIYTSGSTGEPKGARYTHRTVRASAESVRDTLGFTEDDSTLSFLPYCHAGERIFGLYTRILCGMRASHVERPPLVWDVARASEPTIFGGLPRWFEKVHETLSVHEQSLSGARREQWSNAIRLGRSRSALRRNGFPVPASLETAWQAAAAPCRDQVHALLGARVRLATSGGAALPVEVADYLDASGLTVLGAYGQTEHLCVAFHRPDCYDTTTAGPPMPGTEVTVADDGELLIRRNALTFDGYHGKPEATREAFTADGQWLKTGDLAELVNGRIRIIGRKKELIALSNGKKVAPLPIEAALTQDSWIAHAMLYGEGERFITALLVPRRPVIEAWVRERGLGLSYGDALTHPALLAHVQQLVDRVNAGLSRPEQVRRWTLLEHDLAPERGELTPTLKIRRSTLVERYRARLEPLYR